MFGDLLLGTVALERQVHHARLFARPPLDNVVGKCRGHIQLLVNVMPGRFDGKARLVHRVEQAARILERFAVRGHDAVCHELYLPYPQRDARVPHPVFLVGRVVNEPGPQQDGNLEGCRWVLNQQLKAVAAKQFHRERRYALQFFLHRVQAIQQGRSVFGLDVCRSHDVSCNHSFYHLFIGFI